MLRRQLGMVVPFFIGDFNLHIPANALWFVTLLALTLAQSVDENDRRRRELPLSGRLVLAVVVLLGAAGHLARTVLSSAAAVFVAGLAFLLVRRRLRAATPALAAGRPPSPTSLPGPTSSPGTRIGACRHWPWRGDRG